MQLFNIFRDKLFINLARPMLNIRTKNFLRENILNRNVLILGSGPSAVDLVVPPDDCLVIGCNYSGNTLPGRKLDIYMYSLWNSELNSRFVEDVVSKVDARHILSDDPYLTLNGAHYYESARLSYLYRSFKNNIDRSIYHYWPSTGLHLCYLCILNGAKEVYLSGFEFEYKQYKHWDVAKKLSKHEMADHMLAKMICNSQGKVYSCSPQAGSAQYFPYKDYS